MDNLMVYYTHARLFDDPDVLQHASQVLAASILDMEEKMVIYFLTSLDAEFYLMVLQLLTQQEHTTDDDTLSIRLSLLVAIYCNLHRDELSTQLTMFERLTDEKLIPILDVKAAQVLLDIEQELKDDSTLTSLKNRCIDIVSHHWNTALLSSKDQETICIPPLNGEALRHFTLLALTRAKQQIDAATGHTSNNIEATDNMTAQVDSPRIDANSTIPPTTSSSPPPVVTPSLEEHAMSPTPSLTPQNDDDDDNNEDDDDNDNDNDNDNHDELVGQIIISTTPSVVPSEPQSSLPQAE
jgi:hypothetical protein